MALILKNAENFLKKLSKQIQLSLKYSLKACDEGNIKFVHISTDHLYDGKKSYYSEKDKKSPLNKYGETKSIAEDEILRKIKNQ